MHSETVFLNGQYLPLAEEKISVQDVITFQRSTYEGTIYDMTYDPTWLVPDGKGGYMSFYLKDIEETTSSSINDVKEQIINMIMSDSREQVLSDYFARLRDNADIQMIRKLNN